MGFCPADNSNIRVIRVGASPSGLSKNILDKFYA